MANSWLPSPFTFVGAVFGATRRIAVTVSAIIEPLHDPLRLAEDIAVLDLLSAGRLVTVAGIGYRPEEYERAGVEWGRRGRLQDELLETLLAAWTGEPFPYRGRTARVTPRPYTRPHPTLLVGGSSRRRRGWGCRCSRARICRSWRRTTGSGARPTGRRASA